VPIQDSGSRSAGDVALMRAIASGDRDALGAFYDLHASAVMGLCVRVLSSRNEAEETVADIFVELWERAAQFDPARGSPLAYLMNLGRSRAIDRLRHRRRHTDALAEVAATEPRPDPSDETAALGCAIHGERCAIVRKALDVLDVRERRVVELSFFQGLTHREIAAALQEPIGTVKTRIRRGLIRLRDELSALEDAL
jgi:RNA polymerase sigma-70 factor (ECF subfamily)